ncbi:hypothetical protein ABZ070_36490 [Streptomyces sp. NPDC006283]|uniref:hypothetical protein n=1 Tax=Streptomyces sp. NPDC006283 TaxID=3156741 RepID=UPI0033BB3DD7
MTHPHWLPSDFLLLRDRPVRQPLRKWAEQIRRALTAQAAHDPPDTRAICSLINLAALIEASRGDRTNARAICTTQVIWLAGLLEKGLPRGDALPLALQPWINLGRLLRVEARTAEALDHFRLAHDLLARHPVSIGPLVVEGSDYTAILEREESSSATLWNIYTLDCLKTYFRAGAFEEALRFASRLRETGPAQLDPFLTEAEVISFLRLGEHKRAYELCLSQTESDDTLHALTFLLYQAAALIGAGSFSAAKDMTAELTSFLVRDGLDWLPASTAMRYLDALGQTCEDLGDEKAAGDSYGLGLERAIAADDEPCQAGFLQRMIQLQKRHAVNDPTEALKSTLDSLRAGSYYEVLRSTTRLDM